MSGLLSDFFHMLTEDGIDPKGFKIISVQLEITLRLVIFFFFFFFLKWHPDVGDMKREKKKITKGYKLLRVSFTHSHTH